ncbi:chorismate-binding protein [Membranihabitans marinus]|uniref:chorismate-binding protein n=1 Tax=Membranihabitans marinus TaxID=1227546 RepID=UPI001F2A9526|nr:chorismate-binding protein [Membranihabitans marinus]
MTNTVSRTKAVVFYSLPGEEDFFEISGPTQWVLSTDIGQTSGFVFAPFDSVDGAMLKIVGESQPSNLSFSTDDLHYTSVIPFAMQWEEYRDTITSIIQSIKKGEIQKLVFSISKISSNSGQDYAIVLQKLREAYPQAFVYLFSAEETGTWVGASPELLMQRSKDEISTVALAGTLKDAPSIEDWGEKELEEHRFVEAYIEECLQGKEYQKLGPKPINAGPIFHLSSTYTLNVNRVEISPFSLHPGPALSGTPVPNAIEWIKRLEKRPRRYYSGFLGPVLSDTDYQLYINIRCMEVLKNDIVLYAGGGITKDSNPEQEWQELQFKFSTLQTRMQIKP